MPNIVKVVSASILKASCSYILIPKCRHEVNIVVIHVLYMYCVFIQQVCVCVSLSFPQYTNEITGFMACERNIIWIMFLLDSTSTLEFLQVLCHLRSWINPNTVRSLLIAGIFLPFRMLPRVVYIIRN